MVYAATLTESQRVMRWWLIIEEFGPNIQHISGFDSILAYMLIGLPYTSVKKYKTSIVKAQFFANKLFAIVRE